MNIKRFRRLVRCVICGLRYDVNKHPSCPCCSTYNFEDTSMIHLLDKREARVYKKGFSIIARFEMEGIWYQRCLCARTGNVFLLME